MNGQDVLIEHRAPHGRRPAIHPLRPADGRGVLTEDAPAHHPWQHGLATGLHAVGDCDFWLDQGEGVGRIEPVAPVAVPGHPAAWTLDAAWRHHRGEILLHETQHWSAAVVDGLLVLDLAWTLSARRALRIGRHAYGGLFLRMPYRAERGASVRDSEGRRDAACEQQRARWVAVTMPIDGRSDGGGVAILDHPGNAATASAWRVDGQRGVGPSPCIDGPWTIEPEAPRTWRYRMLAFGGGIAPATIEHHWQEYAR